MKITPEAVKERIAALESAGELSLKEQFYLEALRQLVAAMDSEPVQNHIGSKNSLDAIVSFIKSKSNPTVKCYEEVSEQLFKDNCHGIHSHVIEYILKLGEELEDLRAEQDEIQSAPVATTETISFDEWSRKCALQITLCYPDFREKAKYIWDSARETQQLAPAPVVSADLLHTAASAIEDLLTTKDRTGAGVWFDLPFLLRSAANAQPAPVVPDDVLKALQKVARIRLDMDGFDGDRRGIADCLCDAEEALIEVVNRRAAMLQAAPVCTCHSGDGSLRWPCQVHPGNSPVVPNGIERVASMAEYLGNFAAAAIIRQLAANQPQNAQQNIPEIIPDSCTWTFSNYDDHWSGTCGAEWVFNDGGPEENGVKFCPKCGKSVAVSATEGTEE